MKMKAVYDSVTSASLKFAGFELGFSDEECLRGFSYSCKFAGFLKM